MPTLNRIREVRRREGVSVRTLARHLEESSQAVREMERPDADLRLSELLRVAQALEVPAGELMADDELNDIQRMRGLLVRVSRALNTIVDCRPAGDEARNVAEFAMRQIAEEMPGAEEVSTLPRVGFRRPLNDLGVTALHPVRLRDFLNPHVASAIESLD